MARKDNNLLSKNAKFGDDKSTNSHLKEFFPNHVDPPIVFGIDIGKGDDWSVEQIVEPPIEPTRRGKATFGEMKRWWDKFDSSLYENIVDIRRKI